MEIQKLLENKELMQMMQLLMNQSNNTDIQKLLKKENAIDTKDIKKHSEFDNVYMANLYKCAKNKKEENNYCSDDCKNNCYEKQKYYFDNMSDIFEIHKQCIVKN